MTEKMYEELKIDIFNSGVEALSLIHISYCLTVTFPSISIPFSNNCLIVMFSSYESVLSFTDTFPCYLLLSLFISFFYHTKCRKIFV